MNPTLQPKKVRSWEIIFIKAPPRQDEFLEDSDEEDTNETRTGYVRPPSFINCAFLKENMSLFGENNSGKTLPQQMTLCLPFLYPATRTRLPWMQEGDLLEPPRSLEYFPNSCSNSDSEPDFTILRGEDQPSVHHIRPFSNIPDEDEAESVSSVSAAIITGEVAPMTASIGKLITNPVATPITTPEVIQDKT